MVGWVKGSGKSLDGSCDGFEACVCCVKGRADRSFMDSVMVGWKRPPWGEWWRRCVGRHWPSEKKRLVTLKVVWCQ